MFRKFPAILTIKFLEHSEVKFDILDILFYIFHIL